MPTGSHDFAMSNLHGAINQFHTGNCIFIDFYILYNGHEKENVSDSGLKGLSWIYIFVVNDEMCLKAKAGQKSL